MGLYPWNVALSNINKRNLLHDSLQVKSIAQLERDSQKTIN